MDEMAVTDRPPSRLRVVRTLPGCNYFTQGKVELFSVIILVGTLILDDLK